MKMEPPWPSAVPASGPMASAATRLTAIDDVLILMDVLLRSVRKRPQPQLLLGDLPQSREPQGLDDQEEDDEPAEHHQLDLLLERDRQVEADGVRRVGQEDRHQHDEAGAEEGAEHAAQPADDRT